MLVKKAELHRITKIRHNGVFDEIESTEFLRLERDIDEKFLYQPTQMKVGGLIYFPLGWTTYSGDAYDDPKA